MEYIIPAIFVLIGNLLGGRPGTRSWEAVTAFFGLTAIAGLIGYFVILIAGPDWLSLVGAPAWLKEAMMATFGFAMLHALTRDYERIFMPIFDRILGRGE